MVFRSGFIALAWALLVWADGVGAADLQPQAPPQVQASVPVAVAKASGATASAPSASSGAAIKEPTPAFSPRYGPAEVQLTEAQISAIRAAMAERVIAYHRSLAKQNEAWQAYQEANGKSQALAIAHQNWKREHTKDVYGRHALFSTIIFVVVLVLVGSGLFLTWIQFSRDSSALHLALKQARKVAPGAAGTEHGDKTLAALVEMARAEQSIEIGKEGMKLKTRLVGLVTLIVSMGFFYLYLVHVYPITVNRDLPVAEEAKKDKD
jgi:hypothetical protein